MSQKINCYKYKCYKYKCYKYNFGNDTFSYIDMKDILIGDIIYRYI